MTVQQYFLPLERNSANSHSKLSSMSLNTRKHYSTGNIWAESLFVRARWEMQILWVLFSTHNSRISKEQLSQPEKARYIPICDHWWILRTRSWNKKCDFRKSQKRKGEDLKWEEQSVEAKWNGLCEIENVEDFHCMCKSREILIWHGSGIDRPQNNWTRRETETMIWDKKNLNAMKRDWKIVQLKKGQRLQKERSIDNGEALSKAKREWKPNFFVKLQDI